MEPFDSKKIDPSKLDKEFNPEISTEKPQKRQYTRRKKSEQDETQKIQTIQVSGEMIRPGWEMLSRLGVSMFGECVKLSEDEIQALSIASGAVITKYLPSTMEKYGPEITLLVLSGTVFADKYLKYSISGAKNGKLHHNDTGEKGNGKKSSDQKSADPKNS